MMRRLFGWRTLTVVGVVAVGLTFGVMLAGGQGEHGIGFSVGCVSPLTKIGDPYVCNYTMRNNSDDFGDDLTVTSIVDTVFAFDGAQTSPNIINAGRLVLLTAPGTGDCTRGTGSGTVADPWVNSTQCTLFGNPADPANGAQIQAQNFSFYTVRAGDFAANPQHLLTDQAVMTWQDLCTSGAPNCPDGNQTATAGSSTTV